MAGQFLTLNTAGIAAWVAKWGDWALNTDTNEIHIGIPGVVGGLQVGGVSAGAVTLLGLLDTPDSYGSAGLLAKVDVQGSGLEFGTIDFATLSDVPKITASDQNKVWAVKPDLSGFELQAVSDAGGGGSTTFLGLTDTPASFAAAGMWWRTNTANAALEQFIPRWHEMANVDVAGATNLQQARFESATNTWKAFTPTIPTFTDLFDTPNNFGSSLQVFRTNAAASGLEWGDFDLGSISNVALTAPITGDTLVLHSSGFWQNSPPSGVGDVFVSTASWAAATLTLTLQDDDVGTPDIVTILSHAISTHSDVSVVGRGIGSMMWWDGTTYVHLPAPTLRQGLGWDPIADAWQLEELLLVDLDADPFQVLVGDAYVAGSMLTAGNSEDTFNILTPGTVGQQLEVGVSNIPAWTDKVPYPSRRFANRAAAVAADWTGYNFPVVMVLDSDTFNGVTGFTDTTAGYILLAAPSATIVQADEIPIGPRWFDQDGKWAGDAEPFPNGSHATSNVLARNAHCAMFASASDATPGLDAFQSWLPPQTLIMSMLIPSVDIVASTTSALRFQSMITGQATRWTVQSVGGDAAGNTDVTVQSTGAATAFTNQVTVGTGNAAANPEVGLSAFLAGYGGSNGLIRENDRFHLVYGPQADNTYDLQVLFYGFDLTPTGLRV